MARSKVSALRERIESFEPNLTILEAVETNSYDVLELVTEQQLYEHGMRGGDGRTIWEYAPYKEATIRAKERKNQPTDRVTLRDTGEFHESFELVIESDAFKIQATDDKTKFLTNRYGEGVLALSDEHLEKVKEEIIVPHLIQTLRQICYGNSR